VHRVSRHARVARPKIRDRLLFGSAERTLELETGSEAVGIDLHICEACGRIDWYSRAIPGDNSAGNEPRLKDFTCNRCGGTDGAEACVLDAVGDNQSDRFSVSDGDPLGTQLCMKCGHIRWYATDAPKTTADPPREKIACVECGERSADWIEPVRELPDEIVPVVEGASSVFAGRAYGHFALRVCAGCMRADWFARDVKLGELHESLGLELVEGRGAKDRGPYR